MTYTKTELRDFLNQEVEKVKGVYYPVKAGIFRRLFIHKMACSKLHPNPNDEFCFPDIGPNMEIISHYEKQYRSACGSLSEIRYMEGGVSEPIIIEKTSPDGYMILNGHHRWIAARRGGFKKIPVEIVDLTQEKDIRKMLNKTGAQKRAVLDLDEVVFCGEGDSNCEKAPGFPFSKFYKDRIRIGIPALFHFLNSHGYDIWVYTPKYYSLDYIRHLFMHYRVRVTGIVTGTARKGPRDKDTIRELDKMLETKYKSVTHIDLDTVFRTVKDSKEIESHQLDSSASVWSGKVMEIIGKMDKA